MRESYIICEVCGKKVQEHKAPYAGFFELERKLNIRPISEEDRVWDLCSIECVKKFAENIMEGREK